MKNRIIVSVLALLATATQVGVTLTTLYSSGASAQLTHMAVTTRQTHGQV